MFVHMAVCLCVHGIKYVIILYSRCCFVNVIKQKPVNIAIELIDELQTTFTTFYTRLDPKPLVHLLVLHQQKILTEISI